MFKVLVGPYESNTCTSVSRVNPMDDSHSTKLGRINGLEVVASTGCARRHYRNVEVAQGIVSASENVPLSRLRPLSFSSG